MSIMERISIFFLAKLSFKQQLVTTFTLGIILLALISSFWIAKTSTQTIESQLLQQGRKVTLNLAHQSTLALLYLSVDSAQEAAEFTSSFPDIVGVALYTDEHTPLLLSGVAPLTDTGLQGKAENGVLLRETELLWDFSTEVYAGNVPALDNASPFSTDVGAREIIGYVHVIKSKKTLNAMGQDILQSNIATSALLASALLILLLLITNRVIRPIRSLARRMKEAELGDYNVRAKLQGPSDILHMEQAFNVMMDELQARQQELERARDSALSSALLKGQFVASISHELRTPMNSILGMMELIAEQPLDRKALQYLKVASQSSSQLLRLIDDILDFSKLESAKMHINYEIFDLDEVLQDVTTLLNVPAKTKKLLLGSYLAPDIPRVLNGDAGRIRQILINLLGNAIKFTPSGCITLTVSQVQREDGQLRLRFEVTDTGIGIAKSAQRLIFQAFTQADNSTTRLYGGTGLGLAISRQLVNLMGGELGVISQEGKGSTFWLTLDFDQTPDQDEQEIPAHPKAPTRTRLLFLYKPMRHESMPDESARNELSLTSDNSGGQASPASPRLTMTLLSDMGYQVDTANSAEQATSLLDEMRPNQYALVLSYPDSFQADTSHQTLLHAIKTECDNVWVLSEEWREHETEHVAGICYLPSCLNDKQLLALIDTRLKHDIKTHAANATQSPADANTNKQLANKEKNDTNILIVEDNRTNQYVACAMLEKLGFHATLAGNGEEALLVIEQEEIDLIFMDCHMPVMDGYETTRAIRQQEAFDAHIPIIAMTADTSDEEQENCFASGMDDFMPKPLNLKALREKLQHWLPKEKMTVAPSAPLPPPIHEPDILDEIIFGQLKEETGHAFAALVTAYLEDTPETLDRLSQAVQSQDKLKIQELCHLLKGSSATLGANRLAFLAAQLQMSTLEQDAIQDKSCLDMLNTTYTETCQRLSLAQSAASKVKQQVKVVEHSRTNSPYILIVDDDRSTRLGLRGCLEQDDYAIHEAENGLLAVDACRQKMPDLILMDAMMREMDGFDAMKQILQLPTDFNPPILMLTASDDNEVIERAFNIGATDFIAKPVNLHVLRKRVAHLVRTTQAERHVHQLAFHDQLTGLPNRRHFLETLEQAMAQSQLNDGLLALMFLDLDRFKLINDTQGHEVGDMLLEAVAKRIIHCVRNGDQVARLGGDEFTVVLENIHSSVAAAKIATKICATLAEPFTFMDRSISAPVSIGISLYPTDGQDFHSLMKHADTAMYRAKASGGNTVQFYEYGMEAELSRRIELERDLRHALKNDELVLHYQPQIELKSSKVMGAEALVRWHHPERGLMPPDEFISLAEESGLILPLGEWVLEQSCKQMKRWLEQGYDLPFIAVNVSGQQIKHASLLPQIQTLLKKYGLDAKHLQLEMTESIMAVESEACLDLLNGLRDMGLELAIDDFGTGYSSLSYLIKFPVDTLKIDRSFIRHLPDDPNSATVATGIIALAHKLKMRVIAEGVETEAQKTFLRREKCNWIQGYIISRPLPAREFETWLSKHTDKLPK
jgi:diguanylate cyclase (GGDEF)-like protein